MTLKETIFIRKQTNYWYETVTELIKDPIIALVGFDYSTPPLDDDEEARVFAKEHNCIFKIISYSIYYKFKSFRDIGCIWGII